MMTASLSWHGEGQVDNRNPSSGFRSGMALHDLAFAIAAFDLDDEHTSAW
jgi:hypothetical protein